MNCNLQTGPQSAGVMVGFVVGDRSSRVLYFNSGRKEQEAASRQDQVSISEADKSFLM